MGALASIMVAWARDMGGLHTRLSAIGRWWRVARGIRADWHEAARSDPLATHMAAESEAFVELQCGEYTLNRLPAGSIVCVCTDLHPSALGHACASISATGVLDSDGRAE